MYDCISVKPLPTKEIPVDSEDDNQDSDVSMEDASDSDYIVEERMEGLEVQS